MKAKKPEVKVAFTDDKCPFREPHRYDFKHVSHFDTGERLLVQACRCGHVLTADIKPL